MYVITRINPKILYILCYTYKISSKIISLTKLCYQCIVVNII